MNKTLFILLCFLVFSANLLAQNSNSLSKIASTPPMGWNSYNCYGATVTEKEIKENADFMAEHMKQYGWQYVVVDFCWSYPHHPKSTQDNPGQMRLPKDKSYQPWLSMDSYGRLIPFEGKFPSAVKEKGFRPLSDYVHSKGLKFGIHIMRGIPRQAVWEKTPVWGVSGITADMIADTTSTCEWLDNMYGIDMKKKGAQGYLNSLVKLYADWDVDFLKLDDIANPYHAAEIEGYHKAIQNSGRLIILSISPGATPVSEAANVAKLANQWRMSADFWDNWTQLLHMFDLAKTWEGIGKPGAWPDCDMLQIGKLSKRGPVGKERFSRFAEEELYTHMTFWCLFRSPLMIGGNLPENRELEMKLITNPEVISVNQNGINPRQLLRTSSYIVWASNMQNSEDLNIAIFNISDKQTQIDIPLKLIGLKGKYQLRDLWKMKDIGSTKNQISVNLKSHEPILLRLRKY